MSPSQTDCGIAKDSTTDYLQVLKPSTMNSKCWCFMVTSWKDIYIYIWLHGLKQCWFDPWKIGGFHKGIPQMIWIPKVIHLHPLENNGWGWGWSMMIHIPIDGHSFLWNHQFLLNCTSFEKTLGCWSSSWALTKCVNCNGWNMLKLSVRGVDILGAVLFFLPVLRAVLFSFLVSTVHYTLISCMTRRT